MFMLAVVKKLPQNMGRSNSGFGKAAKSNTCQDKDGTKLALQFTKNINHTRL